MTIKEKYLERRKKSVNQKIIDTCSPTLKTDQNLAYTSRCVKDKRRNKPQNVLNISRGASYMASDTLST